MPLFEIGDYARNIVIQDADAAGIKFRLVHVSESKAEAPQGINATGKISVKESWPVADEPKWRILLLPGNVRCKSLDRLIW